MPRRILAPALLLLASLTLTSACATVSPPADSAPSRDGRSRTAGTDAATSIDPSRIKGVNIVSDSSTDRSCPWATAYPDVPGADAMTAAMKKDVEERLAVFRGEDGGGGASCGGAALGAGVVQRAVVEVDPVGLAEHQPDVRQR
ncbi:hypothetical protein ABZ281_06505, partial [Streptomyces sp. NPDC006265]|uniref:hypothetical protein n=1 Tax=Streptomyces sp. NPDC006265 TaxID=3156740 RepID=UPI0033A27C38